MKQYEIRWSRFCNAPQFDGNGRQPVRFGLHRPQHWAHSLQRTSISALQFRMDSPVRLAQTSTIPAIAGVGIGWHDRLLPSHFGANASWYSIGSLPGADGNEMVPSGMGQETNALPQLWSRKPVDCPRRHFIQSQGTELHLLACSLRQLHSHDRNLLSNLTLA